MSVRLTFKEQAAQRVQDACDVLVNVIIACSLVTLCACLFAAATL